MEQVVHSRPDLAHSWPANEVLSHVPQMPRVPLVLDLDQTLIRSDLLVESAFSLIRGNPLYLFRMIGWALKGRAHLKRQIAAVAELDPSTLPVNEDVAAFAAGRKSMGQQVIVATASDEQAARKLMVRFPFVDEVIGSDGVRNLKGAEKARLLQMRFPHGFDYAGDSAADLHIWRVSKGMILVEPSGKVARAAQQARPADKHFKKPPAWKIWAKALRVHQWAKNGLIFAPLVLSGMIASASAWTAAALAFAGLSLTASATYVINDLLDLPHDRKHRSKSRRPLASGRLPLVHGILMAAGFMAAGLALATLAGWPVLVCILAYTAVTLAYSCAIKRVPFLDTVTLASLFTLRLVTGIVAVSAPPSSWLLTFSMFLFLSLSLAKRFVEIGAMQGRDQVIAGRGYRASDGPIVGAFGVAAAVGSIVLFILYLHNEADVASTFTATDFLWLFPVLLFLWLSRIWILCSRGEMDDDPVAFSIRDRVSIWIGAASVSLFATTLGLSLG